MTHYEVCQLISLDDEKAVMVNLKDETYVLDIDVFYDKKKDEIKVDDYLTLVYEGREQREDGSFVPNVVKLYYDELDASKLPETY